MRRGKTYLALRQRLRCLACANFLEPLALSMLSLFALYALSTFSLCSLYALSSSLYALAMLSLRSLSVLSLCSLCSLYALSALLLKRVVLRDGLVDQYLTRAEAHPHWKTTWLMSEGVLRTTRIFFSLRRLTCS